MARAREDRLTDRHPLARLVIDAMDELAADRPLFHSEADFQLALAWTIQRRHPTARIRLEQRLLRAPVVALDILVRLDHEAYGLELEYVKSRLSVAIAEEQFQLAAGAPDVERYDVLTDVVRLGTTRRRRGRAGRQRACPHELADVLDWLDARSSDRLRQLPDPQRR